MLQLSWFADLPDLPVPRYKHILTVVDKQLLCISGNHIFYYGWQGTVTEILLTVFTWSFGEAKWRRLPDLHNKPVGVVVLPANSFNYSTFDQYDILFKS
jgi:hypothetical protein